MSRHSETLHLVASGNTLIAGPGPGFTAGTGTIHRGGVMKTGGIFTTQILVDLTGAASSTTDLDIIGKASAGPANIGQVTTEHNGTILAGTMKCLEAPAGGVDDIDLYSATVGTGVFDGAIASLTETALLTAGSAWTLGEEIALGAFPTNGEFLYLTGGAAGTAADYTAGKFLITLYGYTA